MEGRENSKVSRRSHPALHGAIHEKQMVLVIEPNVEPCIPGAACLPLQASASRLGSECAASSRRAGGLARTPLEASSCCFRVPPSSASTAMASQWQLQRKYMIYQRLKIVAVAVRPNREASREPNRKYRKVAGQWHAHPNSLIRWHGVGPRPRCSEPRHGSMRARGLAVVGLADEARAPPASLVLSGSVIVQSARKSARCAPQGMSRRYLGTRCASSSDEAGSPVARGRC